MMAGVLLLATYLEETALTGQKRMLPVRELSRDISVVFVVYQPPGAGYLGFSRVILTQPSTPGQLTQK